MSNNHNEKFKLQERAEGNPFSLPENYFSTLSKRIDEKRIREDENDESKDISKEVIHPNLSLWNRVRPHLALAATIAGFALISITALQFILGDKRIQQDYYDLSLLDEAGILDESVLQESIDFGTEDEDVYSEWEQDAMAYLASNEVDLNLLLNEN